MDWYAWLCRAGLHPDVAFEYALLFARNELGAADVRHLDHEFLLSMGVAVAKHRLEILKLARKDPPSSSSHGRATAVAAAAATVVLPWRATRLLAAAVHRSARSALGRLRASVSSRARDQVRDRDRGRAASVLATPRLLPLLRHRGGRVAHSSWTKIASPVAVRGGKLPMLTHVVSKPVLLTNSCADKWRGNGGAAVRTLPAPAGSIAACLMSTDVCSCDEDEEGDGSGSDVEVEVVVEDVGGEEMRWESMFQDLKPT